MTTESYGNPYIIWLGSAEQQTFSGTEHKRAFVNAATPEQAKERGSTLWGVPAEQVQVSQLPR